MDWKLIENAVTDSLPDGQKVLCTDGVKTAVFPFRVLRDRHVFGGTNITHYAVITLPDGRTA